MGRSYVEYVNRIDNADGAITWYYAPNGSCYVSLMPPVGRDETFLANELGDTDWVIGSNVHSEYADQFIKQRLSEYRSMMHGKGLL